MESRQEQGTIKKRDRETTKHGQHLSYEYKEEAPGYGTETCWEQKILWVCMCVCVGETVSEGFRSERLSGQKYIILNDKIRRDRKWSQRHPWLSSHHYL